MKALDVVPSSSDCLDLRPALFADDVAIEVPFRSDTQAGCICDFSDNGVGPLDDEVIFPVGFFIEVFIELIHQSGNNVCTKLNACYYNFCITIKIQTVLKK